MSATAGSNKNKQKTKTNPQVSEQRLEQAQSSIPVEPIFQSGVHYNDHFPPFGNSPSSHPCATNMSSSALKQTPTTAPIIGYGNPSINQFSNSTPQLSNICFGNFVPLTYVPRTPVMPTLSNMIYQNPVIPQHRSTHEQNVLMKLSEIILTIHGKREFVSRERVQTTLFAFFHVTSWPQLGVHPGTLGPLVNLTDRLKKVTFFMQIFGQVVMLCTLYDLGPMLAKFLQVNTYEDAHLGPLEENPEVKRVFRYEPTQRHQPIPLMTSADVITLFIDFQDRYRRNLQFGLFLDELVYRYQLRTRGELGLYCKSFPFLVQVTSNVRRNSHCYINDMQTKALKELTGTIIERLSALKQEMHNELNLSTYNKKKSPIAVFNHLTSIVEKCLPFVSEQPFVYNTLIHLRQNDLLQWLFNLSIYLGTIQKPAEFLTDLQRIFHSQDASMRQQIMIYFYQSLPYDPHINPAEYARIQAMIQHQQNYSRSGQLQTLPVIDTSSIDSMQIIKRSRPKLSVTEKEFCSYLYEFLINYETPLTIQQILQIENHLCTKYGVDHFDAFRFDENETDEMNVNFVSFLADHQTLIDPNRELSVYGYNVSTTDRQELLEFVNQFIESNNDRKDVSSQDDDIDLNEDHLYILEKAVKHKFDGLAGFRTGMDILRKAKQSRTKTHHSIIRFEESLLDFHYLDRVNTCPSKSINNVNQLCQFILQCPIMTNLYTWLQWNLFFQHEYGNLKLFIRKHTYSLQNLFLLETSTDELLRLPNDATLKTFEEELASLNIRSAVGHLCALITCEYGLITRLPLNVYRTSMHTWFTHLQSLSMIEGDDREPMKYILQFLTYLPVSIGRTRLIQEIILGPLDDVFWRNGINVVNTRATIWKLADEQQRSRLEIWGHTLDINDWKNNNKWSGQYSSKDESIPPPPPLPNKSTSIEIVTTHPERTTLSIIPVINSSISQPKSNPIEINENQCNRSAFEHIESIRRSFGVDSGLDLNSQSIVNNYQGILQRSLQKLSQDLYSDQGHFLLELIQNADDNQYPSDVQPTLRFVLSDQRILVCNNEIGFQSNNIDAICNVGTSTKGKHKQGYAGHKGIGFKSVFMISNQPEVHSNDYHFYFDTVGGTQQMGYILPIWLDQSNEILPDTKQWTTCFRLPIQRGQRLQENFDQIQGKLLLFLNRLRRIEILGQLTNSSNIDQSRSFTRIDHADGKIIELQEKTINGTTNKTFWLVIKRVVVVPEDIKEKLRDVKSDIHSTTIAIAYPLDHLLKSIQQLPSAQPLFAYLPLRSYGFRFIIQADFEIPVTRQEILHDNPWNEWIKNEMVQLLPEAYIQFQQLPEFLKSSLPQIEITNQLTSIEVLIYFLKLIPNRNELDRYFNSFVDKTLKILMGMIQLPVTYEDEYGEKQIQWIQTSQCVLVKDPFIRQILPQQLLFSHFNKYYVPEQLTMECHERTLIKLGCAPLQFSSIIRLIKELYKRNEQEHSTKTSTIEQIAQWLLCIDYILQQQQENDPNERFQTTTTIDELKQLKIFPLTGQSRLISIDEFNDELILFPLSKINQYNPPFRTILEDLPRLDQRLLQFIEDKFPRRYQSIESLLKKLGMIDKPKLKDIYRLHIRPTLFDSNRWSKKSDSVLIAFLLCIYTHFDQFENELDQLQKNMIIKTHDGKFIRLDTPGIFIHLTSIYGCTKSLQSLTSLKHQFTFISDDYINQYREELFSTKDQINKFARFLQQLNITEFLQVNNIDTHFINVSQLKNTKWSYLIPKLSEIIHQPFIIDDYHCQEFQTLVTSLNDIDFYAKLLVYFDQNHQILSKYYTASIILTDQLKSGRRRPETTIPSTFSFLMREYPWIPIEGGRLSKPDDVYCLHPKSDTLFFRRYIQHLDQTKVSLTNQQFLLEILGIKQHVLPLTIFELFIQWSCRLDRETIWTFINQFDIIPCTQPMEIFYSCFDTIDNIRRVYKFLLNDQQTFDFLSRFRCWPLIFVPRMNNKGDFLFPNQVYWNDPTSLFNQRISIEQFYRNDLRIQQFFLQILQVQSEPTLDDYFPLLTQILSINDIWKLIEIIIRLTFEQNRQLEIKERCFNLSFIPCMSTTDKRVKYSDGPFYPHDVDIAKSLSDRLLIIQLPGKDKFNANKIILKDLFELDWILSSQLKNDFCLLFQIQSLSNVIQFEAHVENEQLSIDLFHFYSHSIELIQDFLVKNSFITNERSKHLTTVFARLHFVCVDQIELSYNYQDKILRKELCETYLDERAGRFFILKQFEKSEIRYIECMAKYLLQDQRILNEVILFMMNLSRIYRIEGEQSLIQRCQSIMNIEQEYKWRFPNVYFIQSISPIEDIPSNEEPVDVSNEMIEQLINESTPERKVPSRITTDHDGENNPTCFPAKANAVESSQSQPKDSTIVSNSNQSASALNSFNSSSSSLKDAHVVRVHTNASVEETTFKHIRITTLTGSNVSLLRLSAITVNPNDHDIDTNTGRLGEQFVYHFLQWKYPKDRVKWMNEKRESGLPYDIQLQRKNNSIEFIEVKTTRISDQHTFQISIAEIECLLKNPNTYQIYRVYYSDDVQMTKISILDQVKNYLEQKQLALCMTILQQANQ